ncbi:DUF2281 domain-containing protein [Chlorobaculum thiosulfatiphilum]|uniref:DUF2281 domain-containing protein n=1 Tax=Chlorobaculum thiosulfatiphilum TaxID=115852 RepID=A0A5C4S6E6_CHLTI|nr:DUF2281 domain-containing protein [Chlorobaculum thiosulfatiphilum]TNJ38875.1 DUF2281 domain-containing protein [Chlorobaculum thiosulfatiphilum]
MTTAEKINKAIQDLSEPMLHEVLDFAEFLKQKRAAETPKPGNIAERIHKRFAGLDAESIPFPERHLPRTPPSFDD